MRAAGTTGGNFITRDVPCHVVPGNYVAAERIAETSAEDIARIGQPQPTEGDL